MQSQTKANNPPETDNFLLAILLKKQKELNLSDEKMASTLNCSRSLWQFYRTGRKQFPKFRLLRSIVTNYPELCIDVFEYLRGNGGDAE